MAGDWKSQLSTFSGIEASKEVKPSIIVDGLTISAGDIITVREPSEKVFLPHGVACKDLKVLSIDPEKRIIIFEGYEHALHVEIVDSKLVTLTKSGGQEKKAVKEPRVGDRIALASNYGPIQLIRDGVGNTLETSQSENPMKLITGAEIVEIIQEGDNKILIVKPLGPTDKRLYKIIFSNKVRIIGK